jgi:hypothetical protein
MRSCWLLAGPALWFGVVLSAQVRLTGRVVNNTNAPVANAALTIYAPPPATFRVRTFTDASGAFSVQLPAEGEYLLDAEATGHYPLKNRSITAGSEVTVALPPVREFAEAVDVSASVNNVGLDQVASEQTLTGANVLDIPFPVTHNVKNAMRALPGVVQDGTNGVHLNGGAENQSLYLLNGFNIGDPLTMRFDTRLSIESVQTMDVEAGTVSAEYGKGSAGVVSIQTRTGDDRIRYSATNFIPGVENQKGLRIGSWNPRVNISGPIRRGRVWFSDSLASQYDQTVIRELPSGQDTATSLRFSNFLTVQANLTPANIANFGFLATSWRADRNGLGALDPPETTTNQRSRQWFAYAKDQIYFGRGAVAEFGFASNRTFSRQIPQGHDIYVFTPYGRSGNFFVDGVQEASRDEIIGNAYLPSFEWMGTHQIKVGTDLNRLSYWQNVRRTGYEWLRADLSPVRRVLFAGDGELQLSNFETTAFVQDSWRLRSNLLLEVGLRSDWDNLLGNWTASPRFGIAWSPKALETTRISGGYAITYDATNLQLFTRPEDQYPVTYYYPPYGDNTQPVRSLFEIGPRRFASPRFQTVNAAVDHRVGPNIYLHTQWLRRRGANGLAYGAIGSPALGSDTILRLQNLRADRYDSLEFTLRQNFRREYGWMASYTHSSARSSTVLDLSSDTPLLVSENSGRLPWDAPNRIFSWAYLPTFWKDWAVAYLAEYRTGFPFSIQNEVGEVVGSVNGRRYPDFFELNLHIEKRFHFRGQRWALRAGCNNITGHNNPNVVNNYIDSPQFLAFYGGQSRALNFRIRWLGKL